MSFKISQIESSDVFLIKPNIYDDKRGFFFESFNEKNFTEKIGQRVSFVQDNHSKSVKNVLRGLHYQIEQPQGKLVRVIEGSVFDVAVDLRKSSSTFGKYVSAELSSSNGQQMWVPEGYAHGFLTMSDTAEVLYKTTNYYAPQHERCIAWDDPILNIRWPSHVEQPILSPKDAAGQEFAFADLFA